MAQITLAIPDPLREWVESRLGDGLYATAGDYLAALIDRDRADDLERENLVAALEAGERSGISDRRVPDVAAALRRSFPLGDG